MYFCRIYEIVVSLACHNVLSNFIHRIKNKIFDTILVKKEYFEYGFFICHTSKNSFDHYKLQRDI